MSIRLLKDRRFWPLFWTQFSGAFNDNLFKNGIAILITYRSYTVGGISPEQMVSLCGGLMILPFFLFSAVSGQLADKFRKPVLIRIIKIMEIFIMILGMYGFITENIYMLLTALFCMGVHSTLFGPLKYSIIPSILNEDELVAGNAYIESGTFIAILLGSIIGVQLISVPGTGPQLISGTIMAVAVTGLLFSLAIKPLDPAIPELKINLDPVTTTYEILKIAAEVKSVFYSIIAISWFWFVGMALLSMIPVYCRYFLYGSESVITLFMVLFSVGIGAGSILCEKLSFKKVEPGLVPMGTIGMSLFAFDLFLSGQPLHQPPPALLNALDFLKVPGGMRIAADLFLFSVSGGFFTVPLYTHLQQRSAAEIRSRVIAGNNIMNAIFMVVSSLFLASLYRFNLTFPQIFLVFAVMNIAVSAYIYVVIPEFLTGFAEWNRTHILGMIKDAAGKLSAIIKNMMPGG